MDRPGTLVHRLTAREGLVTPGTAGRPAPATLVGVVVAVPTVVAALLRVGINAPVTLPRVVVGAAPAIDDAVLLVGGLGALALGLLADSSIERVGLVAAGVFGVLAALVPAAALPATGVAVVGALAAGIDRAPRNGIDGRVLVALGYVVAMVAAIGAAIGILGPGFRAVGAWATLVGLAALSTIHRPGRVGWVVAGVAMAGVLVAGIVSPFLTGAVVLIVAGVIGAPLVLVAAGIGGAVAAIAGSVATHRYRPAVGAVILVAAGVPASLPRAVAAVVGLVLVLDRTAGEVAQ